VGSLYEVCLDAHVLRLPRSEADVEVSPSVFVAACVREINLELVRAPLFSHASHTLQVGPELPQERRMADVDAKCAQKREIPTFAPNVTSFVVIQDGAKAEPGLAPIAVPS
jgi:hypothetical protein